MLLSHQTLNSLIKNQKLVEGKNIYVGPASVDLTLDRDFVWPDPQRGAIHFDRINKTNEVQDTDVFVLKPFGFVLGSTTEVVNMPVNVSAMIQGRSSVARLGMQIHCAAGFIDCGFKGKITLEISNLTPFAMYLPIGKPVCQLICFLQDYASEAPYTGRYQGQDKTTASRFDEVSVLQTQQTTQKLP